MEVLQLESSKLDVLLEKRGSLGLENWRRRHVVIAVLLERRLEDAVPWFAHDYGLTCGLKLVCI